MSSTFETTFENLAGRTTPNGIFIERLVAKRPAVVWSCRCIKCNSEFNLPHSKVRHAACPSSICGRPARKLSKLQAERAAARERELARVEEECRLAELRMQSEVDDYERPQRYAPLPSKYQPMSERERMALRQRREEQEAEERAEREVRERPIREAEERVRKTYQQIATAQRERLMRADIVDPDLYISPELDGVGMSHHDATIRNISAFAEFFEARGLAPSDSNFAFFTDYYKKNKVNIVSADMLERLYTRAVECGIIFEMKRESEPGPVPYDKRPQANLNIAPAKQAEKPQPQTFDGFDLETGEPRVYTEREVSRMSSDQFRKAMQMVARNEMALPNVGPGPKGRSY